MQDLKQLSSNTTKMGLQVSDTPINYTHHLPLLQHYCVTFITKTLCHFHKMLFSKQHLHAVLLRERGDEKVCLSIYIIPFAMSSSALPIHARVHCSSIVQ